MSAVDPTADDAVPAATSRAVPVRAYVTWAALALMTVSWVASLRLAVVKTHCPDKVPTPQKFLDQRFDTVVRA
jgi:hypothetical protein